MQKVVLMESETVMRKIVSGVAEPDWTANDIIVNNYVLMMIMIIIVIIMIIMIMIIVITICECMDSDGL